MIELPLVHFIARNHDFLRKVTDQCQPRHMEGNLNFSSTFRIVDPVNFSLQSCSTPIPGNWPPYNFREDPKSPTGGSLSHRSTEYRRAFQQGLSPRSFRSARLHRRVSRRRRSQSSPLQRVHRPVCPRDVSSYPKIWRWSPMYNFSRSKTSPSSLPSHACDPQKHLSRITAWLLSVKNTITGKVVWL